MHERDRSIRGVAASAAAVALVAATLLLGAGLASAAGDVGTITEFPYPTGAIADGIATGPDGNLWFTAQNGGGVNRIGRMKTSGAVTMYDIPTQQSDPAGIVAGLSGLVARTVFVVT